MTLIECFDPIPIRNALACLRLQPDKVIFLGDMEIMESKIHAYRQLFTRQAKHTQIELHHARLDDLDNIYHTLKDIVDQEDECVIDVTGGAEQLLMAVGALTIGQKEKKLSVQKFDLRSGNVVDVDGDGKTVCGQEAQLTAQELIRLQGGTVYPYSPQPAQTYRPGDIQKLCITFRPAGKQVKKLQKTGVFTPKNVKIVQLLGFLPHLVSKQCKIGNCPWKTNLWK